MSIEDAIIADRQRIEDALLEVFQQYSMSAKLKADIFKAVWPNDA